MNIILDNTSKFFPIHQTVRKLGFLKFPYFHVLPDYLSDRVYVMGRKVGFDIHYVIIFWQFTCCKHCFQAQMRVKVFLGLYCCHHSKPPSCFWNEPHLLTNASLCSDSSQYAIFSQSLIRFIRSLHLDLKHKRCPNDWGGSKWMCSKKARKKRNKWHFTTSCIQYIHLYLSYVLYFVIFSLFFSSQDVLYMKND